MGDTNNAVCSMNRHSWDYPLVFLRRVSLGQKKLIYLAQQTFSFSPWISEFLDVFKGHATKENNEEPSKSEIFIATRTKTDKVVQADNQIAICTSCKREKSFKFFRHNSCFGSWKGKCG